MKYQFVTAHQKAYATRVAYQRRLAQTGLVASMIRKGNCYDNAVVEGFFSTLKMSWCISGITTREKKPRRRCLSSLRVFYNGERLHQTLGYVSPVQFERTCTLTRCP